ncbi:unnamed protein product [Parajaminaea phylloscopi]
MTTPNPPSSESSVAGDRSTLSSPRPRFNTEQLTRGVRTILQAQFAAVDAWPRDKEQQRQMTRAVCEQVKHKMLEIEPRGFKYVVQVQLVENLGQGGRADLSCHWEDSDTVIQDMYINDALVCTVSAFAIRAY